MLVAFDFAGVSEGLWACEVYMKRSTMARFAVCVFLTHN